MNILFISNNLLAGNIAYRLVQEGHSVKLWIGDKAQKKNFDNLVPKTKDWKKELNWVGKKGLIVFDESGFGKTQDKLRKNGYTVFGGSELGERLEFERKFGQQVFSRSGIKTVPLIDFNCPAEAEDFATRHPNKWVIKQNSGRKKISYVGQLNDGRDVVSVLNNYSHNKKTSRECITLQERIDGVEIGIGRYFNGKNWVGPIEYNLEHTRFFPDDLGPITSEMGTLAWYDNDESNPLYRATIAKLKDFLVKADFRGDFEIDCIVNEKGIFPLEATPRLGSPIIHLHDEIHTSPWGEFLYAIAKGQPYDLKWKKGYGIVLLMAVPPFPHNFKMEENLSDGVKIFFDNFSPKDYQHLHLEEVTAKSNSLNDLYVSNSQGYICYVTNMGKTVSEARTKTYEIARKIIIPKVFYRNDIGLKFETEEYAKLKSWGYLK